MLDQSESDCLILDLLKDADAEWRRLGRLRDRLIDKAIADGFSERTIGAAAGISGPAVHARKRTGDDRSDDESSYQGYDAMGTLGGEPS